METKSKPIRLDSHTLIFLPQAGSKPKDSAG